MNKPFVKLVLLAVGVVSLGLAGQIGCNQRPGDGGGVLGTTTQPADGGAASGPGTIEELLDQLGLGGDGEDDGDGDGDDDTPPATGFLSFTKRIIQERVFPNGRAVVASTFALDDVGRTATDADFNGDGQADLVVGYGRETAVVQLLLTQDGGSGVDFLSLTLDGLEIDPCFIERENFYQLLDVAVGDVDNDGALDIVCCTVGEDAEKKHAGVWLLRNPDGSLIDGQVRSVTDARYWSVDLIIDSMCIDVQEFIDATFGPGVHVSGDFTDIKIEGGYTNVALGDMDNDGDMDVVASMFFKATYSLGGGADPIIDKNGLLFLYLNPGGVNPGGTGWTRVPFGRHEREQPADRAGASDLLLFDLDGDGDLDVINVAGRNNGFSEGDDTNVQVAWFQNPIIADAVSHGDCIQTGDVTDTIEWCQWRIGSMRDAFGVDIADVTGDGRPDVVASSPAQQQVFLFKQPDGDNNNDGVVDDAADVGPKREYDWDTFVLATVDEVYPQDCRIVDLDGDGDPEVVTGDTDGGIYRYVKPPSGFWNEWEGLEVETLTVSGFIGRIGVGDVDGDGDPDLGIVLDPVEDAGANDAQVLWIRTNR